MDINNADVDKASELVSIVVPVYNGEKTIERALDSILNQNYKNIEVLIIDDGSIDNTRTLCLPYVEKYSNFTLLSIKNEGVSNARNLGIEMAKGEYITFFDADDELMPTFISEGVELIKETESEIVCFNNLIIKKRGGAELTRLANPLNFENNIVESVDEKKILISLLICGRTIPGHYYGEMLVAPWGKLFRLELLKNNSIKFPYGVRVGEDSVFLIYAFSSARRIAFKNEYLYKYYVFENSACHRYRENMLEVKLELFNATKKALDDTNTEIENLDNLFFYNVYCSIITNAYRSDKLLREKIRASLDVIKNPLILDGLLLSPPISWKHRIRRTLARLHCYSILVFLELFLRKIRDRYIKKA